MSQNEYERLAKEMKALRAYMEKQNQPKRQLGLGVVKGVGVAIGGTIVFSVILGVLGAIVARSSALPFIDQSTQQELQEALPDSSS